MKFLLPLSNELWLYIYIVLLLDPGISQGTWNCSPKIDHYIDEVNSFPVSFYYTIFFYFVDYNEWIEFINRNSFNISSHLIFYDSYFHQKCFPIFLCTLKLSKISEIDYTHTLTEDELEKWPIDELHTSTKPNL